MSKEIIMIIDNIWHISDTLYKKNNAELQNPFEYFIKDQFKEIINPLIRINRQKEKSSALYPYMWIMQENKNDFISGMLNTIGTCDHNEWFYQACDRNLTPPGQKVCKPSNE